jgi:hypothetical protein
MQELLHKFKAAGVWPVMGGEDQGEQAGNQFEGHDLCDHRDTAHALARRDESVLSRSHGGKVTDSVSKKTSYLVIGEVPVRNWIKPANWACRSWTKPASCNWWGNKGIEAFGKHSPKTRAGEIRPPAVTPGSFLEQLPG